MNREDALNLVNELADAGFACSLTLVPRKAGNVLLGGDPARIEPEHCMVTVTAGRLTVDELVELSQIGRRYMLDLEPDGGLTYYPSIAGLARSRKAAS